MRREMTIDLLPAFIRDNYEVHEWKHACAILSTDFPDEWKDICDVFTNFRLKHSHIAALRERGLKSRIIVLSAHLTDEVRQTYKDLGVQAIFEKPFDIARLHLRSIPSYSKEIQNPERAPFQSRHRWSRYRRGQQ